MKPIKKAVPVTHRNGSTRVVGKLGRFNWQVFLTVDGMLESTGIRYLTKRTAVEEAEGRWQS